MTEREYRQDDQSNRGWCPACGQPVTTVYVDGAGWCPDHGRVWTNWNPLTGPVWLPPAVDPKSGEEYAS